MEKLKQKICDTLESIETTGDYCCGAKLSTYEHPGLSIDGYGDIGFPLSDRVAKEITPYFEQAPYGRETQTLVDKTVRNTLQLSPSKFKLINPKWIEYLRAIIPMIGLGLGVKSSNISLHLYKLLLYETGSFFKPHRDTEKQDKMFATLIIQLPSKYEGGSLVIKHKGSKQVFDFADDSQFGTSFVSLYCDCEHEVLPVKSGYRINLVYNVVFKGTGSIPQVICSEGVIEELKQHFLKVKSNEHDAPLVYILSHSYTKDGLSFSNLKGKDLAIAEALKRLKSKHDYDLHLCLISYTQTGHAEGGYRDNWSMGDIYETEIYAEDFIDVDNKPLNKKSMGVDPDEEVLNKEMFDDLDTPDKEEVDVRYGNEGAHMSRLYKMAALVFWIDDDWAEPNNNNSGANKKQKQVIVIDE